MKIICKCGNIEELKKDSNLEKYRLKNCDDGTVALVCKKCSEIAFIGINK